MSLIRLRRLTVLFIWLAGAGLLAPANASQPVRSQRPLYVPGQLIVKYKPGFERLEAHLAALRALTTDKEHSLAGIPRLNVVDLPQGADVLQAVRQLEASGMVEYAEPNYYRYPTFHTEAVSNCDHGYAVTPTACVTPNDPSFDEEWYAQNLNIMPHADIGLTAAWGLFCAPTSSTTCGNSLNSPSEVSDFDIAIIDDGFDLRNADLTFLSGTNCAGSTCSATSSTAAQATKSDGSQDHGTYVASTMAAVGDNSKAMTGVLWHARIVPIKSDLTDSSIVAGIEYAIGRGVKVINESFGGPVPSKAEYDALTDAENAGILVVVSAGNSDSDNDRAGAAYPANYAAASVIFPKTDAGGNPVAGATSTRRGLPNVLAVAASDDIDKMTSWSEWGSFNVALLAPGESIIALQRGANGGTANVAGTSFSSPITAGTAALVGQYLIANANPANPDWHDLKAHLLNGSERSQNNRSPSALDGRSATGRLNAYLAMQDVTHGVVVVRQVTIDDSASGNNDGEIDPGETAVIDVTVANVGADDSNVQGTLSYVGSGGLAAVDPTPQTIATMAHTGTSPTIVDSTGTMSFATVFGSFTGFHDLLFKLTLTSSGGLSVDRYFYLEAGQLANKVTVDGKLTQNAYDDFQDFHVDVPSGARNLLIYSTTPGGVDIDLIAMKDRLPQYLETLGVDNPSSDPEFQQYIEPNAQSSGRADGDESIAYDGLSSPFDVRKRPDTAAGTYHVVVVNFTGVSDQPYTLTACYAPSGSDEVTFDGNYEYDEAAGKATLTLLRSGNSGAVSVHYATQNGGIYPNTPDAIADKNYTAASGTVNWANGDDAPKTFSVPLINTGAIAKNASNFKHFTVNLSAPTGGLRLGCISKADVAIGNPDTVIPSSGGSSGGGGGGNTPPPSSGKSGGGMFDLLSLLALGAAFARRRR